jgi:hypothetical protein
VVIYSRSDEPRVGAVFLLDVAVPSLDAYAERGGGGTAGSMPRWATIAAFVLSSTYYSLLPAQSEAGAAKGKRRRANRR